MKVDIQERQSPKCESSDSRHVEANSVHKIIQNNKMPSLSQCSFAPPQLHLNLSQQFWVSSPKKCLKLERDLVKTLACVKIQVFKI